MRNFKFVFSIFALAVVSVSATPTAPGVEVRSSLLRPRIQLDSCGGTCGSYCMDGGYSYWICTEGYVFHSMVPTATK